MPTIEPPEHTAGITLKHKRSQQCVDWSGRAFVRDYVLVTVAGVRREYMRDEFADGGETAVVERHTHARPSDLITRLIIARAW